MSRGGPGIPRRFSFKNMPLKDPALQRFGDWSDENRGFYISFRQWLKDNGYSKSALNIYGAAIRTAIGFLQKPYWAIDLETDIERVRQYLAQSQRAPATTAEYCKGMNKLAEFLRVRRNLPKKEKELPWAYTVGSLSPQLQEDIHAFLKHCQRAWKNENLFERGRDRLYGLGIPLRWMAEHQGVQDVRDLTPQVWFAWPDQRLETGACPATVNSDLTSLRHFVQFLYGLDRVVCEKFLLVEPLDIGFRMPKDVAVNDLRKLQAVIQAQANSSHAGMRRVGLLDQAWFLLMLHCGLRTCEVRYLKLADIDWESRRLKIEQSKGLKDRHIYLDDTVLAALKAYLAVRGQKEYLPKNVFIYRHLPLSRSYCFQRLETYGLRCSVQASPHRLRHSCATLLLNAGAPAVSVQMILGHKRIDSTLGYARLYDGTIAADYYSAMNTVERQLALPEDSKKEPMSVGQLIALTDALRGGSLNSQQTDLVRALREGLGLLEAAP